MKKTLACAVVLFVMLLLVNPFEAKAAGVSGSFALEGGVIIEEEIPSAPIEEEDVVPSTPAEEEDVVPSAPAEEEDVVPSTPAEEEDVVPSTPAEEEDVIPSTPVEEEDAVPSTPAEEQDVVPSTPAEDVASVEEVVEEDIPVSSQQARYKVIPEDEQAITFGLPQTAARGDSFPWWLFLIIGITGIIFFILFMMANRYHVIIPAEGEDKDEVVEKFFSLRAAAEFVAEAEDEVVSRYVVEDTFAHDDEEKLFEYDIQNKEIMFLFASEKQREIIEEVFASCTATAVA